MTVTVVDPVYDYTMEKTAKVPEHESGMVREGETIGYTIRVQNTGNRPLEEIRITDTLKRSRYDRKHPGCRICTGWKA